jgi:hypothetical protein
MITIFEIVGAVIGADFADAIGALGRYAGA